jgi:hypothetical protein
MSAPTTSGFSLLRFLWVVLVAVYLCGPLGAQNAGQSLPAPNASTQADPTEKANSPPPIVTTREKWRNFEHETVSLLTVGGGTFNAVFSQVTHTDPKYGGDAGAFAERFGASVADITTQNFFGDFVVASALHEDPRYFRMGSGHPFWTRVGYAISRAAVIRKDSGGNTFNFDNLCGSAFSASLSNLYYPPESRTAKATFMNWGIDVADNGFVNLAPEFWPDFRDKVLRRIIRRRSGHPSPVATESN